LKVFFLELMVNMPALAERLKSTRLERKLTQPAVARACEIAERALRYYESGKHEPTASVIVKLCQFFNVSSDWLLGLSDKREVNK